MGKAKVIAVSCLKGGTGKTTTSGSLGAGLALQGKRVLFIDADSQHSLTVCFGIKEPEKLPITLATVMQNIMTDTDIDPMAGIIQNSEGVDILPSNSSLAKTEMLLVQAVMRETILRQYIDAVKQHYDYVIIDCPPTLDLLTTNALAAADSVIIPVVPKYLDAKGLELLMKFIAKVRQQLNPSLSIEGILLTMVEGRATFTRDIITSIQKGYGGQVHIFKEHVPRSVRVTESSAHGFSIFKHDPTGKVTKAYAALVKGVLDNA
jgi:chromosome partitioning protein